jgi:hypothetical protein
VLERMMNNIDSNLFNVFKKYLNGNDKDMKSGIYFKIK